MKIIKWIGTTKVPATKEKFVAKEKFRNCLCEVRFNEVSKKFSDTFLDGKGKVEEPTPESLIRYGRLENESSDELIIEMLGGEDKSETTLSDVYSFLAIQGNGESGILLTNKLFANIFYIRDSFGVLRPVILRWCTRGWDIYASTINVSPGWPDGFNVFSRHHGKAV